MHQHRSSRTLFDLKCGALHFIFNLVAFLAAAGLLIDAAFYYNTKVLYAGIGVAAMWILSCLLFLINAHKVRCPLCMVPLFVHKKCTRSKKAKRVLGSYRLGVSLDIVCKGQYRCTYCGEPFDSKNIKAPVTSHG